jgi:hypothetical protein
MREIHIHDVVGDGSEWGRGGEGGPGGLHVATVGVGVMVCVELLFHQYCIIYQLVEVETSWAHELGRLWNGILLSVTKCGRKPGLRRKFVREQ